ncbi:MAG: alcohol dehydrogenase catalytic domain-containing protein [Planctomycetota bacterium]|nr:alcohol dehydrogenase catalytic domain-containing protein [Planctomycetota bacterium]
MKALRIDGPGRLALAEVPEPPCPPGECRVAVRLAGICRTDLELAKGYLGFTGIPGHEFVGTVLQGPENLQGRRVVGEINVPRDLRRYSQPGYDPRHEPERTVLGLLGRPGAFAETLTLPPENLWPVPDSVSDEDAVFTEPLAAALEIFEQLHVPPGEKVLVLGDGKLGLLVAQAFARHGCRTFLRGHHDKKMALANRWGVVPQQEAHAPADKFPLVVEATGSPSGFEQALRWVRPRGTVVLKSTYAPGAAPALDAAKLVVDEIRLVGSRCGRFAPALRMLAQGRFDVRALIDHRVPFERIVEGFELAAKPGVLKVLATFQATSR